MYMCKYDFLQESAVSVCQRHQALVEDFQQCTEGMRYVHMYVCAPSYVRTQDFPQDLGLAIQECLSLMSAAYRGVKGQHEVIVEALILENIYSVSKCGVLKFGVLKSIIWCPKYGVLNMISAGGDESSFGSCKIRHVSFPLPSRSLSLCMHASMWRQVRPWYMYMYVHSVLPR